MKQSTMTWGRPVFCCQCALHYAAIKRLKAKRMLNTTCQLALRIVLVTPLDAVAVHLDSDSKPGPDQQIQHRARPRVPLSISWPQCSPMFGGDHLWCHIRYAVSVVGVDVSHQEQEGSRGRKKQEKPQYLHPGCAELRGTGPQMTCSRVRFHEHDFYQWKLRLKHGWAQPIGSNWDLREPCLITGSGRPLTSKRRGSPVLEPRASQRQKHPGSFRPPCPLVGPRPFKYLSLLFLPSSSNPTSFSPNIAFRASIHSLLRSCISRHSFDKKHERLSAAPP
ncbi:hypothetical protein B0T21DRAFT_22664 [Apiosordaria backusii]|uniref:Uncharacterized protein n=1 Tax=Apiosordaria backusii TaxID=314023 RepID=A0AA40EZN1_9PEZI|nr:hypothetical protein B0T21DRAFT_22664 [Apiosordaria backusii]